MQCSYVLSQFVYYKFFFNREPKDPVGSCAYELTQCGFVQDPPRQIQRSATSSRQDLGHLHLDRRLRREFEMQRSHIELHS